MSESKSPNQGLKDKRDVASMSVLQLFASLKPAQVWAVITVLLTILCGAFGLGYKLGNLSSQTEIARLIMEKARLEGKVKEFRAIQTKERFLALYLRYLLAKDAFASDSSVENRKGVEEAGAHMRSYIEELLKRGEEAAEDIDLRGLFLGKTPGTTPMVKFGYDGSVWPLPREFGFAAYTR